MLNKKFDNSIHLMQSLYMDLVEKLQKLGLTEKEARIYLSLLELEVATANEVAEKAGVNRSSTYVVLDSLLEKGLVSFSDGEEVRRYVASSPSVLADKATEAAERQTKIKMDLLEILPELKSLYKEIKYRPKIRIFEGKEGLVSGMNETLESNEKFLRAFTSGDKILSLIPGYMLLWSKKLLQRKINVRGIYVENFATRTLVSMSLGAGKSVFVPKKDFPFPIDVLIWDSKVGYLITDKAKTTTIIIENDEVAQVMKGLFDMAFEHAKTKGKFEIT
jgi:HTH-type transcriptional regulator, sugar sensing transcriptional regulator